MAIGNVLVTEVGDYSLPFPFPNEFTVARSTLSATVVFLFSCILAGIDSLVLRKAVVFTTTGNVDSVIHALIALLLQRTPHLTMAVVGLYLVDQVYIDIRF